MLVYVQAFSRYRVGCVQEEARHTRKCESVDTVERTFDVMMQSMPCF